MYVASAMPVVKTNEDSRLAKSPTSISGVFLLCDRLELAIGCRGQPFPTSGEPSASGEISSAAEALSALRLHYEETVVRLYSCQCSASTMLRDPATSKADAWKVIHHELADAKVSTESVNCNSELWRKAEQLVGSLAKEDGDDGTDLGVGASPDSGHPLGTIQTNFWVLCSCIAGVREGRFLILPCVSATCNKLANPSPHLASFSYGAYPPLATNSQTLLATWKQEWGGSLWRPRGKKTLVSSKAVAAKRD